MPTFKIERFDGTEWRQLGGVYIGRTTVDIVFANFARYYAPGSLRVVEI